MKKVVRLTESDLIRLVKRVIKEQSEGIYKTKIYSRDRKETNWGVLTIEYLEKVDYEGTELVKFEIKNANWASAVLYFDCETGYAYIKRPDEEVCRCGLGIGGYTTLEPNVENEIRSKYCPLQS
jgi:hypothetical protein